MCHCCLLTCAHEARVDRVSPLSRHAKRQLTAFRLHSLCEESHLLLCTNICYSLHAFSNKSDMKKTLDAVYDMLNRSPFKIGQCQKHAKTTVVSQLKMKPELSSAFCCAVTM